MNAARKKMLQMISALPTTPVTWKIVDGRKTNFSLNVARKETFM
jgi:hypothetical protein